MTVPPEPADRNPPNDPCGPEETAGTRTGRSLFLLVGGVGVLAAGLVGYVVGTNASVSTVRVFGLLSLPGTGLALGLYAMGMAFLGLAALFLMVEVVSRQDR